MVSFAPQSQSAIGPGPGFNKAAFMAARPDISNAGFDFDTWYQLSGRNEETTQFAPYFTGSQPGTVGGGVVPMTVEDLHQFEKQAYTQAANQQLSPFMEQAAGFLSERLGQPTINPQAEQFMTDAGGMIARGAAPITFDEVEAMRNPYAKAVKESLTEEGRRARAALLAKQGTRGAASFGNAAMGEEKGYLEAQLGRDIANVDYTTYNDAYDRLMKERGLALTGGTATGNLGTQAQGLTSSGADILSGIASQLFNAGTGITSGQRTLTSDLMEAGRGIRGYNQGILDLVAADIMGRQTYEPQQLATINSLLDIYKSNTGSANTAGVSGAERLGGLLTTASPFADRLADAYTASTRPSDDFVGPMPSFGRALGF